ncbi:hypothetical protein MDA_GLEAN10018264 [Myotis davidii]|uniref:Uncharacterized protein n=1 Tax=Myotis davidii TaxID=225400 RepID=L5M3W3_MYODS|nr:hypothetical protein MDA_GLEAN10018264 [Myotis davidii]
MCVSSLPAAEPVGGPKPVRFPHTFWPVCTEVISELAAPTGGWNEWFSWLKRERRETGLTRPEVRACPDHVWLWACGSMDSPEKRWVQEALPSFLLPRSPTEPQKKEPIPGSLKLSARSVGLHCLLPGGCVCGGGGL